MSSTLPRRPRRSAALDAALVGLLSLVPVAIVVVVQQAVLDTG